MNYLWIVVAVLVTVLLANFAVDFADWNKKQACVTSGGRNCASRIDLVH